MNCQKATKYTFLDQIYLIRESGNWVKIRYYENGTLKTDN